eukprot:CAMPEP_0115876480 /NCGR_PEP_ID=MMETSP0287-20121206/25693_1 /TAXON_ID=412157 /ORGANISM="Chrysochromulina rotalis, Strain UIO044" /LENGTH=108 /DNA_ID=CAMNT_0003331893 /DNA_START=267 /DNA_END=593 /DNA_ORIENTATION=+
MAFALEACMAGARRGCDVPALTAPVASPAPVQPRGGSSQEAGGTSLVGVSLLASKVEGGNATANLAEAECFGSVARGLSGALAVRTKFVCPGASKCVFRATMGPVLRP